MEEHVASKNFTPPHGRDLEVGRHSTRHPHLTNSRKDFKTLREPSRGILKFWRNPCTTDKSPMLVSSGHPAPTPLFPLTTKPFTSPFHHRRHRNSMTSVCCWLLTVPIGGQVNITLLDYGFVETQTQFQNIGYFLHWLSNFSCRWRMQLKYI